MVLFLNLIGSLLFTPLEWTFLWNPHLKDEEESSLMYIIIRSKFLWITSFSTFTEFAVTLALISLHKVRPHHLLRGKTKKRKNRHVFQMAITNFLDRFCLALRAWRTMAPLTATLRSKIRSLPFLGLPPPRPPPWRNPRKGRDQIMLHSIAEP